MPLPLIYHEDYSPPFPAGHRFPMAKFRLLKEQLLASGITREEQLLRPAICQPEILALAHCPAYIERFMNGTLGREEQRRLGLPWSEALARRTLRAVGGSLLAGLPYTRRTLTGSPCRTTAPDTQSIQTLSLAGRVGSAKPRLFRFTP